ncbi:multidrug resistance-associated ABC transporter [Trametes cingulata]|nr:multidrug resistance-associated ABC transporter [Trametes cingulata]
MRSDASAFVNSQTVLFGGTVVSLLLLLLQSAGRIRSAGRSSEGASDSTVGDRDATTSAQPERERTKRFAIYCGSRVIFAYQFLRLLACISLLGLSIATTSTGVHRAGESRPPLWWTELVECGVYAYTTILALLALLLPRQSALLSDHLSWVLLLTWLIYVYRDVVPLATTTLEPQDAWEGPMLWAKLSVLTVAAAVIPLFMPRSQNLTDRESLTAEQRASWFSKRVYGWLDGTILKARKVDHLPLEELPPLAEIDQTKYLVDHGLKYIDPLETKKDRHIFWGLLRIHGREYAFAALQTLLVAFLGLSWPLATQGVLMSLEEGHQQSIIRPWAWVLLLFLGPALVSIFEEWYAWTTKRLSVRNEALLTELLFQHALRIRVKSETSSSSGEEGVATAAGQSAKPKEDHLTGKLNNLVTTDLANVTEALKQGLIVVVRIPVRIAVALAFMYSVLGWSALVGLATLIAIMPLPGYLSAWTQTYQKKTMSKTDARVQTVHEVVNVVRLIKLFGWERRVAAQINERREEELKYIIKTRWLEVAIMLFNYSIPLITMAVTFAAYTVLMKGELTASKLFSSNSAFGLIQYELYWFFRFLAFVTQGRVSLDRINRFLHETELLDEFADAKENEAPAREYVHTSHDPEVLGIKQTTFTWTNNTKVQASGSVASATPSRKFVLNIDGELLFKRGRINLIVGPTGSGKTSLLMALLGEMHAQPSGPDSFVSLPRSGGVAYAAQESWVLSDTIRNNILFGAPYDEARYAKVIKQCALERDLSLFEAGDQTEVGEKGITLSGGQKARVTLARAVYSSAEILLLDDVLAALDVHTGRWIVDECFKNGLVRGRTVLLVSHNVALVRPIADFVVALGGDGRITSQGSLEKTLQEDRELLAELATEEEQLEIAEQELDKPEVPGEDTGKGKLVVSEEIAAGSVGWSAFRLYFTNASRFPVLYWAGLSFMLFLTHTIMNSQTYIWSLWAAEYEEHEPAEVSVPFYLSVYGLAVAASILFNAITWLVYLTGAKRAAESIHDKLMMSMLGTTLRWLDRTPTSRIIARCTADTHTIDSTIPRQIFSTLGTTIFMFLRVVAAVIMAPLFIVPSAIVGAVGALLASVYIKAQMCVKREMSNARSPVLGHFSSAIVGIVSIRAYRAQDQFKAESYLRVDRYSRAALTFSGLNRWITVRMDIMGTTLLAVLAAYLIYGGRLSASNAGFAMNMAGGFTIRILGWIRELNELMLAANSLERVQQYLAIEQEPKPTSTGVPPAYWPASGDIRVEKLSARYSHDGPRVLHEISFEVNSGERIGIVGRTGSGKSSLTLALLRCILTEGKVYYDGIATDSINLDALRSNITIIPQTPELLSGTLRKNLDPFGQHDDSTLNDALRSAGLFSLQEREGSARLTLDSEIAGGGSNLSVGQRQIIALARAIVRRSKLLILDEATSAIDYETDAIIQNSLRSEIGRDVTVLTVAHRLQSIMDADKILVLDAGRIVEYDTPHGLLARERGYFRGLVDGSGDKATLYARAGLAQAS